jgi:hypothetical protein
MEEDFRTTYPRPELTLLRAGDPVGSSHAGPITRLGLWQRTQPLTRTGWILVGLSKTVVLAALAYYYFG